LAPRFDITRQEVQLANAKLYTLTARNNVALARENLRSAMGLDGDPGFEPHDRTLDYVPVKVDDASALGRALKRRPELLELEARRIAQEERISALQKDYLPMVRGLANYSFTGDDAPSDDGWMIGAVVRMPIFNGGLTPAQIGQARAGLAQIVAEQQRARQDITTEVRAATLEVHRTTDAIGVSRRAVEAAEESLDAAERRYAADVSDVVELTDTQLALSSARANHVRVLADYRNAIAQLERATADKILTGEEFATEKRTKRATSHAAPEKLLPTVEAPAPAERAAAPTAKSATRRPAIATPAAKAESKRPPRIAHAGSKPLASAAKPRGAKGPAAGRGALGAQARGAKQAAAKGARRPRTAPQPKILAKRDR
jgi:hypothetical protein